eukprot:gene17675-biopygen15928
MANTSSFESEGSAPHQAPPRLSPLAKSGLLWNPLPFSIVEPTSRTSMCKPALYLPPLCPPLMSIDTSPANTTSHPIPPSLVPAREARAPARERRSDGARLAAGTGGRGVRRGSEFSGFPGRIPARKSAPRAARPPPPGARPERAEGADGTG